MEGVHASENQVRQPFLAGFASAFKFQPLQEDPPEDISGKVQGYGTKDALRDEHRCLDRGAKGRKRDGGGEWGKSKERLKMARVESDVGKVMERLICRVEGVVEAEARSEARERRRQEKINERQKKADNRTAAKQAKEIERLTRKRLVHESKGGPKSRAKLFCSLEEEFIDDQVLPEADKPPPASRLVGNGLFEDEDLTGLVEAWAFLNRFGAGFGLDEIPDVYQMEQGLSEPKKYPALADALMDIQAQLVNVFVQEAYQAARESMRSAGTEDGKTSQEGCPHIHRTCWEEGFRRYLVALKTADSATSYYSRISSSSLPQKMDLPCRLSILQPRVCLAILCAGVNKRLSHCSPLFLTPSRNAKAFNCLLNRDDAQGMATVEKWLDGQSEWSAQGEMAASDLRRQLDLRRALRSIIHTKDWRSGAPGELVCYHGASSATSSQSPFQWDLHRVASLVEAGAYVGEDSLKLMLADVRSSCDILETAVSVNSGCLPRELRNLGVKAARAVKRVVTRIREHGIRDSDGNVRDADMHRPFMPFEGCSICWKDEDNPRILLCDNCDDEYHLYCLDPPLEEIPQGDWFCPGCAQNLRSSQYPNVSDSDKERCVPSSQDCDQDDLIHILMHKPYMSMSPSERVSIILKICECALETIKLRSHLESSMDTCKETQRELTELGRKISKHASSPGGEEKLREYPHNLSPPGDETLKRSRIQEMKHNLTLCALRPTVLGWDRHFNCYWAFGGKHSPGIFVEKSTRECWIASAQSFHHNFCEPAGPRHIKTSRRVSKLTKPAYPQTKNAKCQGIASRNQAQQPMLVSRPGDESRDRAGSHTWSMYTTRSQTQSFIDFLNPSGVREGPLRAALVVFCSESQILDTEDVAQVKSRNVEQGCRDSILVEDSGDPAGCTPTSVNAIDDAESVHSADITTAANIREELTQLMVRLPEDSFEEIRGSIARRKKWHDQMQIALNPQELFCGLMSLLSMLHTSKIKPHWLMWGFPLQDPATVTSFSAVYYHLRAANAALKVQAKQTRPAAASRKPRVCLNGVTEGVRRSTRVAQLASQPKDSRTRRSRTEVSESEDDWEEDDPSDAEPSTVWRSLEQKGKQPVIETSGDEDMADEEILDSDSDYEDMDHDSLSPRNEEASDEQTAKILHYQLNSTWRSGRT